MTKYPPAKTGVYPRISPNFQNCARCEKDLKDNNFYSIIITFTQFFDNGTPPYSQRLLVFLSALAQKHHPATKSSRCIEVWMPSVSVISWYFWGWVINPQPNPNLEDQGLHLRLVSTLRPFWHGWPYQEYKTPADIALGLIETRKPSHRNKVVTPWDGLTWSTHYCGQFFVLAKYPPTNFFLKTPVTGPHFEIPMCTFYPIWFLPVAT